MKLRGVKNKIKHQKVFELTQIERRQTLPYDSSLQHLPQTIHNR